MVIEAKYEDGVFKPLGKVKIKDGTVVEIHVDTQRAQRTTKSISELGFAGMWSDRTDMVFQDKGSGLARIFTGWDLKKTTKRKR